MPRPKQRSQRPPRLQHQPHCKYYQGEPQGNAAIFDVRSQQEEAEAAARRSRLQLQRLPALTIRRQLQVQWGPTVSLPQPGETPPPGPPPGHNVRLFEVRHGDASAGQTAAAPTAGQAFVVHKHADAPNRQQPLTQPFKPVDVTPLREVPPEQPQSAAEASPQPLVIPAPPPRPPSPPPPQSGIPVRQQTPATRPSSRGRPSRQAATRSTRDQTLTVTSSSARHAHLSGSRGTARSRAAPSASPGARPRTAARSPPRRSSSRRGSPSRRVSPGAVAGAAAARGPVFGPSTPPPPATAARSSRRAPARLDITSTSLPATVPGGLEPGGQSDALFRELSAAAEARRITSIPTTAVGEFVDGPLNVEQEGSPFGDTFAEDVVGMGLAARAETEIDGNGDGDADLWSAAQRIRRQQEVTDIEHRVLDLIGARVVAGLLNKDRKLEFENWGEYRMQQPSLSDEVGEHRVLGEGISLEETEIRTPINYDDYLDQEPADNEAEYNGSEKGDSADGGSPDYEDDFEEEEEEEEANQESPPVSADTREEAPPDQKLASVPEIQVDSESPKDEKSGQATPVVEATPLGPEPAAPSPARSPSSPAHSPPSPGWFGTVRIRSRRTGSVTTVNLPLPLHHVPTPTPTPVSSPERSRPGSTRRVVTPERSPSPRRGDSGRVPTPPPSPEHSRDRVTMYKWRSRLEAPPAPPLTPPASPPPAPPGAFSFTPEATSPRGSLPLPDLASGGALASDAPAEPPVSGRQSSRDVRATTEAPGVPAGYGRPLGVSLTSSSSLTYSSSVSSNPQVVSQDSLSWGEVRLQRDASSSADTQLSQGEVPARAVGEPAWLCSSLSEGEAVGLHRCSRQANAEPGRSIASSSAGAAVGRIENGGIRKDLSEGEVSEGLVPALLPYGVSDDTDSTSVSDTT